jgi:signal transduction histidine kinase
VRIGLASFLVFAFFLIGWMENAFAQTIKSHKISFEEHDDYLAYNLKDLVYFFEEKEPLSWDQAYQKLESGEFELLEGNVFSRGFTESIWWFAFRLENPADSEVEMVISPYPPFAEVLNYFAIREDGTLAREIKSGTQVVRTQRNVNYRLFYFDMLVPPGESMYCLLRMDTRGRHTFTVFYLDTEWQFWNDEVRRTILYGENLGRVTFIIFLGFILLFYFKKRLYLYFALYLVAHQVIFLDMDAYLYEWYQGPIYNNAAPLIVPFFSLVLALFVVYFNLEYFSIKRLKGTVFHFISYWIKAIWIMLLLVLSTLGFPSGYGLKIFIYEISIYFAMATLVLTLWVCINQFKNKRWEALFAFVANAFLSGGMWFYFISILGWYYYHPYEMVFQGYGGLFNAAILVVGMVHQYHQTQKEKDKIAQEQINTEREILKHSIQAQETERHRIAKDLHDDLGGNLALIKLKMELFADKHLGNGDMTEFGDLVIMMEDSCKDLRYISYELMPSDFSSKVLRTMIEELVEKINAQQKLRFSYEVGDFPALDMDVKINLFRIIKELTNNILKHSEATEAKIKLEMDEFSKELKLVVEDNGKGIPNEILDGKVTGMGLSNLKSRVSFLDGRLEIQSSGLGTRVSVWVPVVGEKSDLDRS